MKASLVRRIEDLERSVTRAADAPCYVDGHNNAIRVDVQGKRGRLRTFPTVYEARIWLEQKIDRHAGARISYTVDHIADLYKDAGELRAALAPLLTPAIVVPDLAPRIVNGAIVWAEKTGMANHPVTFDADYLGAILAMRPLPAGVPADLRLMCLASVITRYFDTPGFKQRFAAQELSEEDDRMFTALYLVYSWDREESSAALLPGYTALVYQVARLRQVVKLREEIPLQN